MSEQEDKKALDEVVAAATEADLPENPEWAKGWVKTEFVSPAPIVGVEYRVTSVPATLPENSGSVLRVVSAVHDEVTLGAQNEQTDEQLDAAIDQLLAHPEIDAMLENVAKDAADDIGEAIEEFVNVENSNGQAEVPEAPLTRAEFEEFKARVEKAFKHAGFKF